MNCDGDGRSYPARPILAVGVAVMRPGEVLLARRGKAPNAGGWSLPGGAQELDETTLEAARRELLEETGLAVGELLMVELVDSIHADPDGRVRFHYTIIDFAAAWRGDAAVAGGDVTEIAWCGLGEFDRYSLDIKTRGVVEKARQAILF